MEFKEIIIGFILISICMFSILTFISLFSSDTDSSNIVNTNPSLNRTFGNISKQMEDTQKRAEESSSSFAKEGSHPILTVVGFVFQSLLDLGTVLSNSIVGFFYIYTNFFKENLGISPIIIGALTSILLIVLILALWRVYRIGE